MADLPSILLKLNDIEVGQDKPVTEALFSKIGSNINGLIDEVDDIAINLGNITLFSSLLSVNASGTFSVPSNLKGGIILAWGSGGGGGGGGGGKAIFISAANGFSQGGMGGGGCAPQWQILTGASGNISWTRGAGGAGGAGGNSSSSDENGANGSAGGTTTFGPLQWVGARGGLGGGILRTTNPQSDTTYSGVIDRFEFRGRGTGGGGDGGAGGIGVDGITGQRSYSSTSNAGGNADSRAGGGGGGGAGLVEGGKGGDGSDGNSGNAEDGANAISGGGGGGGGGKVSGTTSTASSAGNGGNGGNGILRIVYLVG